MSCPKCGFSTPLVGPRFIKTGEGEEYLAYMCCHCGYNKKRLCADAKHKSEIEQQMELAIKKAHGEEKRRDEKGG